MGVVIEICIKYSGGPTRIMVTGIYSPYYEYNTVPVQC
jgi:hypothetical protein